MLLILFCYSIDAIPYYPTTLNYRHEEDAIKEWPLSMVVDAEENVADGEEFDFKAKPEQFYFNVEGSGGKAFY